MLNVLNIYASLNGQTRKVSREIERACAEQGCTVTSLDVAGQEHPYDLLAPNLTFIGSGVYTWLPGKPMLQWIDRQLKHAREHELIKPGSPRLPGRFACAYCTYAGPHTGEAEAIPALKYMEQLFDHLGIPVVAEWTIPGAFIPKKMRFMNVLGRLGDISDRPNAHDLSEIREKVRGLVLSLEAAMAGLK
ncbi:flavodoxin domain-containing protein [Pseudodesulfovibrio sediminis]|uniref:Flavodoxin n=1 Tax=Pseudodesulfovibrio sediminis TaxID=2810563 RepID=A0ABN6EP28_9BACT|nr:flavodoxin domain-containing protein [Pseudodesulfovibrio sediminis]BCS88122.1 hypothetical protein PSDVSF_13640 [Pseudodesulfovibrio sediminis]